MRMLPRITDGGTRRASRAPTYVPGVPPRIRGMSMLQLIPLGGHVTERLFTKVSGSGVGIRLLRGVI